MRATTLSTPRRTGDIANSLSPPSYSAPRGSSLQNVENSQPAQHATDDAVEREERQGDALRAPLRDRGMLNEQQGDNDGGADAERDSEPPVEQCCRDEAARRERVQAAAHPEGPRHAHPARDRMQ